MARAYTHARAHTHIFCTHTDPLTHFPYFLLLSWSPSRSCECGVNRLLPVSGAVRGRHAGGVSYGSVQRPLCRAHVGEGWVQPRGLAGVGIVCPGGLVVSVLKLSSGGQRWKCGAIVRQAEWGVGDMGAWGGRGWGFGVVGTRDRFTFDLSLGWVRGRWGGLRLLLLFGQPGGVPACSSQGVGVRRGRGSSCRSPSRALRVTIWREVLVKLVHVKWLDVGHHLMADLADVHGAKIDVGFSTWRWGTTGWPFSSNPKGSPGPPWSSRRSCSPLPLGIWQFPRLEFCLWGGRWSWRAVTLT